MIDRNHPAVEALADAIYRALSGQYGDFGTPSKGEAHAALTAALPHLSADDLRHTPAGKQLMAEAWMVGKFDGAKVCEADHLHNPAKPCTPNPYKETP